MINTPESPQALSADKPIVDPVHDRLEYAPFARHLAESICRLTPSEGLAIAIYGPWGSGKTSLLNLIRHYIQQKPEEEQPTIVPFNPWWFSGHEDLTRRFFEQLRARFSGRRVALRQLREKLSDFADAASEIPVSYASSATALAKLIKVRQQDIAELKES